METDRCLCVCVFTARFPPLNYRNKQTAQQTESATARLTARCSPVVAPFVLRFLACRSFVRSFVRMFTRLLAPMFGPSEHTQTQQQLPVVVLSLFDWRAQNVKQRERERKKQRK